MEDALKRLDKLTHDEALMATAEILKLAHSVDNKATTIVSKVTGIDDKVMGVDNKVMGVDNKVMDVDNKVRAVIDGAQSTFSLWPRLS